jgi:Mannose-6-phosphate isomerase
MFYVIEGKMQIEFEDHTVDLKTGDFIIIQKGTRHRPVCKALVKCLLIEKAGTLNKENTGGTY